MKTLNILKSNIVCFATVLLAFNGLLAFSPSNAQANGITYRTVASGPNMQIAGIYPGNNNAYGGTHNSYMVVVSNKGGSPSAATTIMAVGYGVNGFGQSLHPDSQAQFVPALAPGSSYSVIFTFPSFNRSVGQPMTAFHFTGGYVRLGSQTVQLSAQ